MFCKSFRFLAENLDRQYKRRVKSKYIDAKAPETGIFTAFGFDFKAEIRYNSEEEGARMKGRFKAGDRAYIVESNRFVREVEVRSCAGGMYLVRFLDSVGGIKLRDHRLFASKEEAEGSIIKKEEKPAHRTPYDS